uniref:Reverse transcriptase Ty1/copia-type domain-containing protein n=1 Tax=Fagus sylvatica TaxID=28930 RepID=A0A2N9IMS3_FAGSY
MQTRSKSGIVKKKSFATSTTINYLQTEPPSFTIASKIPEWRAAMASEFDALQQQHTWTLIPPCSDQNLVGCRWVYKIKRNIDGSVSQIESLTHRQGNQWPLRQLDVSNVFLHGLLKESVFMAQPLGFIDSAQPSHVYDIIITDNNSTAISDIISQLSAAFEIKDLGPLRYFLGLQIDYKKVRLFVHQHKYITDLLHKFQMTDCKVAPTPIATTPPFSTANNDALSDPTPFRSLVGALQYATFTRPDIAFAVNRVCQFMHKPSTVHFVAAKRILRYLKGTLHNGVLFQPGPLALTAFTDADWAGDPSDRRSTSGVIVFLGHNPITWLAKKQHTVSRSSTEAEYRSLATGAAKLAWLRQVLCDIKLFLPFAPLIWCDNTSALALASNPIFHGRTKHIELADIFTKALPSTRFLQVVFQTHGLFY